MDSFLELVENFKKTKRRFKNKLTISLSLSLSLSKYSKLGIGKHGAVRLLMNLFSSIKPPRAPSPLSTELSSHKNGYV